MNLFDAEYRLRLENCNLKEELRLLRQHLDAQTDAFHEFMLEQGETECCCCKCRGVMK